MVTSFDQIAVRDTSAQLSTVTMALIPMAREALEKNSLFQGALRWAQRSPTRVFYVVIWRTPNGTRLRASRIDYARIPMRSVVSINDFVKEIVDMWMAVHEAHNAFVNAGRPNDMAAFGQFSAFNSMHKADGHTKLLTAATKVLAAWAKLCRVNPLSIVISDYNHTDERGIVRQIVKKINTHLSEDDKVMKYGMKRPRTACNTEKASEMKTPRKKRYCKIL
jgi:hypothetical protein